MNICTPNNASHPRVRPLAARAGRRPRRTASLLVAALAVALPLTACTTAPAPTQSPAQTSGAPTPAPAASASFSLSASDDTFTIAGVAADEAAKQQAVAAVEAGLGAGVPVVDQIGVAANAWLPDAAALEALASALAGVDAVSLNVNGPDAVLGGTVTSEAEKQAAGQAVEAAFPGATLGNNLAIVEVCSVKGAKVRDLAKPPALTFATGSAELSEAARTSVADIAALVAQCPGTQLTVVGQTDARGAEPGNEALARERAQAVGDALVAAGVPADDVLVQGNAANAPVSDDNALNRRVDVAVR